MEDRYRNIQSIMEQIKTMIINEEKGLLSDMKTEIEQIIQSTDIYKLQSYLYMLDRSTLSFNLSSEKLQQICLFYLISYHVLVVSDKENSNVILRVIQRNLPYIWKLVLNFCLHYHFHLYLEMYYKGEPNEFFTNIHTIWKLDPITEFNLKLVYCEKLMKDKEYKKLIQLIHHHADYFIESFEKKENQLCNPSTATTVLLCILHYQVSTNTMEKVKTIESVLSKLSMRNIWHDAHVLLHGFSDFILTLEDKQILCIPYLIKLLQPVIKEQPLDYLKMILLCNNKLRQANHYNECIKFIKCHFQLISSFATNELTNIKECYYRQQYCITLLLLLDEYVSSHDTHKMNLVLIKLLRLKVAFLSDKQSNSCYCFMGKQNCLTTEEKNMQHSPYSAHKPPRFQTDFKTQFLNCYKRRLHGNKSQQFSGISKNMITSSGYSQVPCYFNLVMDKVIQGESELAPYLQTMIDIMTEFNVEFMYQVYGDEVVEFLIEFIKRSADHNEASLYNNIKALCAFELQPEIQDLIFQGLSAFLMISCKRQYGLLSKFILDIGMICPNSQLLHKLISGIATLSLKFDDDTVSDFRKIIYKCYCTVRHDSKSEKDTHIMNIAKYKCHYTFIESMEAEEEMMKLTDLTNLLLMLTLLLIASGGHHKSAELKKYLSLKYEYRDSILYLLWCSGDVEMNPGPTLHTLRKVPDSVKERNWIYEMCSMLLRLLKYKSIEIRIDGLWKEKPLDWPVGSLFYDPRNKPKGKGYSIKTDRKLLENLEEICNGKGFFQDITHFDDEYTKSTVKQYQKEITAWRTNKADLFELYIVRQELDILLEAKTSLQKYKKEPELKEGLNFLNVDLIYDSEEDMCISNAGYTDIVRDIAITLCRTGKGLDPLEKSDGIWKKPPPGWCLTDEYFSPCNAGKRLGKCKDPCKKQRNCKDMKLVDHLLRCCETMVQEYCKVNEKPVLIKLLHAWKQENVQEVRKYHTIWSNMEVIDHSLKYLKLEGLLAKSQTHLEKLGIKPRATDSKENIQDLTDLSSCPIQGKQTNPKCPTIIQSHQDNHFDPISKLSDSDACEKVVLINSIGSEFQETDQTTQNKTNKRKHQSTDEKYTEPKKLNKSDKGKSLSIATSPTEQCHEEPTTTVVNDQIPLEIVDDIFDLQDEFNLNNNSSSFNIPSLKRISNGDTSHAVQQENVIEGIVAYLKK